MKIENKSSFKYKTWIKKVKSLTLKIYREGLLKEVSEEKKYRYLFKLIKLRVLKRLSKCSQKDHKVGYTALLKMNFQTIAKFAKSQNQAT